MTGSSIIIIMTGSSHIMTGMNIRIDCSSNILGFMNFNVSGACAVRSGIDCCIIIIIVDIFVQEEK